MQNLNDLKAVAQSTAQSSAVSLNAARDAYVLLESERKGEDGALLGQAARAYRANHGCSATEAFIQVGKRAEYLKELAAGQSTFYEAKKQLKANAKNANATLMPAE